MKLKAVLPFDWGGKVLGVGEIFDAPDHKVDALIANGQAEPYIAPKPAPAAKKESAK